jgi:hypothetical protein
MNPHSWLFVLQVRQILSLIIAQLLQGIQTLLITKLLLYQHRHITTKPARCTINNIALLLRWLWLDSCD